MRQSGRQKLNMKYGQTLFKIRGVCANLTLIQHDLGLPIVKVEDLQVQLEERAKQLYEEGKENL